MSLLTEQEINDFDTSKYDHAEISKRDLIRAIEAKARANLLEEIKAQRPVGYYDLETDTAISRNQFVRLIIEHQNNKDALRELNALSKLYNLPEGD